MPSTDRKIKKIDSAVDVFGFPIFSGGKNRVLEIVRDVLQSDGGVNPLVIFTPNPEQIVLAQENDLFCTSLRSGDVLVPDGIGLSLVDWRLRERVDGVGLMQDICTEAVILGKKVFLLGASPEVNTKAQKALLRVVGDTLQVAGFSGSQNVITARSEETEEIFRRVQTFSPDVLFVAFGAPVQELWVNTHRERLGRLGIRVVMVVGGALDMVAGKVSRAPLWMRKIGLEWLWRLMLEPWRWRRQLRLLKFVGMVLKKMLA